MQPMYFLFYRYNEVEQMQEKLIGDLLEMQMQIKEYDNMISDIRFLLSIPLLIPQNMDDIDIRKIYLQANAAASLRNRIEVALFHLEQLEQLIKINEEMVKHWEVLSPEEYKESINNSKEILENIKVETRRAVMQLDKLMKEAEKRETTAVQIFEDAIENIHKDKDKIDITGTWNTNYGQNFFKQQGDRVRGYYPYNKGRIVGEMDGNKLDSIWMEQDNMLGDESRYGRIIFTFGDKYMIGRWGFGYAPEEMPYYVYAVKESDEIPGGTYFVNG